MKVRVLVGRVFDDEFVSIALPDGRVVVISDVITVYDKRTGRAYKAVLEPAEFGDVELYTPDNEETPQYKKVVENGEAKVIAYGKEIEIGKVVEIEY